MAEPSFCTHCGASLSPGSAVCPECGTAVPGAAQAASADEAEGRITYSRPMDREWGRWSNPSGAVVVGIYGALASVLGLVLGLYLLFMSESAFDGVAEIFRDLGFSFRFEYGDAASYGYACLVVMVSGFFAFGSYMVCRANRHWRPAVALCGVAAVVPLATLAFGAVFGVYLFIIGAVVTFALYRIRYGFEDGRRRRRRRIQNDGCIRWRIGTAVTSSHAPRVHRLLTRAPIIRP